LSADQITNIKEEAGDAVWYIAASICRAFGWSFNQLVLDASKNTEALDIDSRHAVLVEAALTLSVQSGIILDVAKKSMFYGKPLNEFALLLAVIEILRTIFYRVCPVLDCNGEDLAVRTIAKLSIRYPEKYTDEAAQQRADKQMEGAQ
jgi:hypothetical protein